MRDRRRTRRAKRTPKPKEPEPEPEPDPIVEFEVDEEWLEMNHVSEEDDDDEFEIEYEVSFSPIVQRYLRASRQILSKEVDLDILSEVVPQMRALLTCAVCDKLLPVSPLVRKDPSVCRELHPMCKECYGKDWKNPCSYNCQNNTDYFENDYFDTLLKSYKDLCYHFILDVGVQAQVLEKRNADPEFAVELVKVLGEGALSATGDSPSEDEESDPDEDEDEDGRADSEIPTDKDNKSPVKDEPPESPLLDQQEDEDFGHEDASEPEIDRECVSPNPSVTRSNRTQEDEGSSSMSTRGSPSLSTIMSRIVPLTSAPVTMCPPVTNWPDPEKVLQYASGNASMDMTRPHFMTSFAYDSPSTSSTTMGIVGSVVRSVFGATKRLKVRFPSTSPMERSPVASTSKRTRQGCRCGKATAAPGKLTCCGQRCPCYVDRKSCVDCRCKGCRNPHLPGGKKLMQGINAVMDTRTNTTTPLPTPSGAAVYSNLRDGSPSAFPLPLTSVANFGGSSIPVQLPLSIVDVTSLVQTQIQLPTEDVKPGILPPEQEDSMHDADCEDQ